MSSIFGRALIVLIICLCAVFLVPDGDQRHSMDVRKRQYRQAVKTHTDKTKNVMTPALFLKLHELFYNGIPDKYDNFGKKITGIKPDHKKALLNLNLAAEMAQDPKLKAGLRFKIAQIYENGMFGLEPDLEKAAEMYETLVPIVGQEAIDALERTKKEISIIATYKWLNLPYKKKPNTHHDLITKTWTQAAQAGHMHRPMPMAMPMPMPMPMAFTTTTPWATLHNTNTNTIRAQDLFRAPTTMTDLDADPRRNDAHNTHNPQVVSTVANSLRKLQELTQVTGSVSDTLRDVRDYISRKGNSDRTRDALKSLDAMERNIIPISSVNMREVDALNIVWHRIQGSDFDKSRDDIKDILYTQLADMQEHSQSVCATGRLERIVDSLTTFDNTVQIKPTYVIHEEMMNKASKLRDDFMTAYETQHGGAARALLEGGQAADQAIEDERLKGTIRDTLQKDYVDTGILTPEKFEAQVSTWIDAI